MQNKQSVGGANNKDKERWEESITAASLEMPFMRLFYVKSKATAAVVSPSLALLVAFAVGRHRMANAIF